jgi:uncharacterized protein YciI
MISSNRRGDDMPSEQSAGYLRGDPRYGLQGEALKDYYRTKPAEWAIYCWDKPGMATARRTLVAKQNSYVKNFGERVIGYGHFVSDDGRDTLGTSFFMQLDDRAAADKFVTYEPMNKAGAYQRVEIQRWSNSFQKRAADYARKGLQQFLCTGPKTGTPEFFREHQCRGPPQSSFHQRGVRRRCELEERAILTQQESLVLRKFVVLAAKRVGGKPRPILFVDGEALDRVDAVSECRRALVRREVADELGAATRDCLSPVASILLELGLLGRINMIPDDAGDHGASPASIAGD